MAATFGSCTSEPVPTSPLTPDKAVDILDVPNLGETSTRTFLKAEGPRGLQDEVLSGRWMGTAPTTVHKIIVEYVEES